MFRTDVLTRWSYLTGLQTLLFLLFVIGGIKAQNSTYLACNDQVHISLDEDCNATITVDAILEGEDSYDPPFNDLSNYSISIEIADGTPVYGTTLTETGTYIVTIQETVSGYGNKCWGTVIIEDKLPPEIIDDPTTPIDEACPCPVGNNYEWCKIKTHCQDLALPIVEGSNHYAPDIPVPYYEDCSNVYISYVDHSYSTNDPCYPVRLKRHYVFKDAAGNQTTSCVMEYIIEPIDIYNDIDSPHGHIELPCNSSTSIQGIYDYFYQIKLNELLPYANTDEEIAEAEAAAHYYAIHYAYPTLNGEPVLYDLCNVAVAHHDLEVAACEGCHDVKKIIRTWSYFDWCSGKSVEFSQIITNGSQDGPDVYGPDFTKTVDPWGCFSNFYMPPPEHLSDPCSSYSDLSWGVTVPPGVDVEQDENGWYISNVPKGVHTFIYHGYDCCGHGNTHAVKVTVVDGTPPTAVATQDLVVSLTTAVNGTGIAKLYAENVDKGSHDGCGPVKLEVRREEDVCGITDNLTFNNDGHQFDYEYDEDGGEYVKFCCEDIEQFGIDEDGDGIKDYARFKVWLRVWDDGDMDGYYGSYNDNYNETWAWVRVEDKAPISIVCPADITLDCDVDIHDLNEVGQAWGYSTCGTAEVAYEDVYDHLHGCYDGYIHRKWYAVDAPHQHCIQYIHKKPHYYQDDVTIYWPQDTLVDCTINLEHYEPYWETESCHNLAWSVDRDTFYLEEGVCYKIFNHWTVIDWCVYDPLDDHTHGLWEEVQVVKVLDDDAPYFDTCGQTIMIEVTDFDDEDGDGIICENNNISFTKTAFDEGECASPWLKWQVQIDLWSDWTFDYVFTSSGDPSSDFYIPPTLPGEEVRFTLPYGIEGSMSNHRIVWKVTDGCGNVKNCTQNFMVVDKKAPTPYCVNINSAVMTNGEVELWACDFDLGSFDNCTPNEYLRFTFSDVHPDEDPEYNEALRCSARTFDCDDVSPDQTTPIEVQVYVWDQKDNVDFCVVNLTLIDNTGACEGGASSRIGGQVITESGEELNQISVELYNSNAPEFPQINNTNVDGHYAFENNPFYFDYQIEGYSNEEPLNGVSTLDLVLIQKHILGIQELDNPYKIIAADASNDQKVSAVDLIEIRKLILGVTSEFSFNDSWRFPVKGQYMDPQNPFPFEETIYIDDLNESMMHNDFIGVKIGDVNDSATLGFTGGHIENRSDIYLDLYFEKAELKDGHYHIDIKSANDVELNGFQFALKHVSKLLTVESGKLDLDQNNFMSKSEALTNFSWDTDRLTTVSKGDVLFSLIFDGNPGNELNINKYAMTPEAYIGKTLETINVQLESVDQSLSNVLFQNKPNPFDNTTTVGFSIAKPGKVSITFFDVSGKTVKKMTGNFAAGYNELTLSANDFEASGIIYYQLETGDFTDTKKMLLIEK